MCRVSLLPLCLWHIWLFLAFFARCSRLKGVADKGSDTPCIYTNIEGRLEIPANGAVGGRKDEALRFPASGLRSYFQRLLK